uniref:Uncharacterized protein n=1 Tax=Arundo donax TaxID=35708 RepID=A0A0A9ANB8_ARUDO
MNLEYISQVCRLCNNALWTHYTEQNVFN